MEYQWASSLLYLSIGNLLIPFVASRTTAKRSLSVILVVLVALLAVKLQLDWGGDPKDNLYSVLGAARHASPLQIRSAFKAKSLELHPDKMRRSGLSSTDSPASAEEGFVRVKYAYDTLMDERRRDVYNRFGEAGLADIDPRFSELELLAAVGAKYVFWAVVAYLSTTSTAARASRTWLSIFGAGVLMAEVSWCLADREMISLPVLPSTTEYDVLCCLHSVFPAAILLLRCVAESCYVDVDAAVLAAQQALEQQQQHLNRVLGLVASGLQLQQEGRGGAALSKQDREEMLTLRAQVEGGLAGVSSQVAALRAAPPGGDPLARHYGLVVVAMYGAMYMLQG